MAPQHPWDKWVGRQTPEALLPGRRLISLGLSSGTAVTVARPLGAWAPSTACGIRPFPWIRLLLVAVVGACCFLLPGAAWATAGSGAQLFEAHCVGCHLHGGNIIRRGKTLKLAALQRQGIANPEAIAQIAAAGIGQMGGYGEALGPGGAEAVAAWVWQQAEAGWP